MANMVKRIPNWLTSLRLALIPLLVFLLHNPSTVMVYAALFIFIVAALTDYVDGHIARRYGAVSDFGKLLDPLADKILVMAALVMLTAMRSDLDGSSWVPGWLVVLVLAREIWVTGLRAVASSQGTVLAAADAGKLKSALQMVSIVLLLLHDMTFPVPVLQENISCQLAGLNLLLISVAVGYFGAVDYTVTVFSSARSRQQL